MSRKWPVTVMATHFLERIASTSQPAEDTPGRTDYCIHLKWRKCQHLLICQGCLLKNKFVCICRNLWVSYWKWTGDWWVPGNTHKSSYSFLLLFNGQHAMTSAYHCFQCLQVLGRNFISEQVVHPGEGLHQLLMDISRFAWSAPQVLNPAKECVSSTLSSIIFVNWAVYKNYFKWSPPLFRRPKWMNEWNEWMPVLMWKGIYRPCRKRKKWQILWMHIILVFL